MGPPSLLLPLLLLASRTPCQGSDLTLLHFNDFHGQILPRRTLRGLRGGIAALYGFVERVRSEDPHRPVWVTDGGDWFQGTPEGNESLGEIPLALMNRLGLQCAVLGNHEFDFGEENLRRLVAQARHPVLAANLHWRGTRRLVPWVRPFQVLTVKGLRVAILGLLTSATPRMATGPFGDVAFGREEEWLRRWLPRAEAESEALILLSHCGLEKDRELARAFPQVQVILGGHSHESLKTPVRVGRTWILQTGGKSTEVYRMDFRVDPVEGRLLPLSARNLPLEGATPPPALALWLKERCREIWREWDRPVGTLASELGSPRDFGSTPVGNLVADLIRREGRARIGIQNKGGIRAALPEGPVTRRMAFELLPFENHVVSMDLRGEDLCEVLREGLRWTGLPFEVSGLRYEIRKIRKEGQAGQAWDLGKAVLEDGSPVRTGAVYRVATNSFLARGGDGASSFRKGRNRSVHATLLRDLLLRVLESEKPLRPPEGGRILVRK